MFHVEHWRESSITGAYVLRGTFSVLWFADTVLTMWVSSPRLRKTFHVERSACDDFNFMEFALFGLTGIVSRGTT